MGGFEWVRRTIWLKKVVVDIARKKWSAQLDTRISRVGLSGSMSGGHGTTADLEAAPHETEINTSSRTVNLIKISHNNVCVYQGHQYYTSVLYVSFSSHTTFIL